MSLRTLIVDDDNAVRFFHKLIVTQSGLSSDPLSFAGGYELLDYLNLQLDEGDYYLILLDVNMPLMNGWQLLNSIEKQPYTHKLHFVMVTSSIDKADREKAKSYRQVIDFIEKPITEEACKKIMTLPTIAGFF